MTRKSIYQLFLLSGIVLFFYLLATTNWQQIWEFFKVISPGSFALLLIFNSLIVVIMSARWWVFLKAFGYSIPLGITTIYRLIGFSISYLTPGPQIGGEPIQYNLVSDFHEVKREDNLAALSLDKIIEFMTNFTILLIGILITVFTQTEFSTSNSFPFIITAFILSVPVIYLFLIARGKKPITSILINFKQSNIGANWAEPAEQKLQSTLKERPFIIILASIISLSLWACMAAEYWYMAYLLGVQLSAVETVVMMIAGRLALLTPFPASIGAYEASQSLASLQLGLSGEFGLALSLLIRLRDLLFSAIGLLAFRILTKKR